jgi:methylated-DNA-[protein]-cysteine S-methyltransferase
MPEIISVSRINKTLVGDIFIAQSSEGICSLEFGRISEKNFLRRLAGQLGPDVSFEMRSLPIVELQLKNYFAGKITSFSLEVDLRNTTSFQKHVLRQTMKVPYGRTSSYGDIAARIGRPAAYRAVGNAVGANPIPIVIPCHRIIASDGGIGGYSSGLPNKRKLLALEGAL